MTITSETKAKKVTKKFYLTAPKQVYIHGPFRTNKGKDFWRLTVGESIEDRSTKYTYKMFGPEERMRKMAQQIADDQNINLAN